MKTNIKKIILIGNLILSNIIFAQEIYLKDNLFYSKNNKEILYSGKDSFKNKNFYGEKIYKNGVLIKEVAYYKDNSPYKEFNYDLDKKIGLLKTYYKDKSFSSIEFGENYCNIIKKYGNGKISRDTKVRNIKFDTDTFANIQDVYFSRDLYPNYYYEEKIYGVDGKLLESSLENKNENIYIKNGKIQKDIFSEDEKNLTQEIYLENGGLIEKYFATQDKNDKNFYNYNRFEQYLDDGTLIQIDEISQGKIHNIYSLDAFQGESIIKKDSLTKKENNGTISIYKGKKEDKKNLTYKKEYIYEKIILTNKKDSGNSYEKFSFGIFVGKSMGDYYDEKLDKNLKNTIIKNTDKGISYFKEIYPNGVIKTYGENGIIKRKYDESGKVIFDMDKNINDINYLKLSNSKKEYEIFYPNGKLAYKKEVNPVKENFLKKFGETYSEESFYTDKGKLIYQGEVYAPLDENPYPISSYDSINSEEIFDLKRVKKYNNSGDIIYNEDFKIENNKFIINIKSFDEKNPKNIRYNFIKKFDINGKNLSLTECLLERFENGKIFLKKESKGENSTISYYYPIGKLKEISKYRKNKLLSSNFYYKNGNLYYQHIFNEKDSSKESIKYKSNGKISFKYLKTPISGKVPKEKVNYEEYFSTGGLYQKSESIFEEDVLIKKNSEEFYLNEKLLKKSEYSRETGIEKIIEYSNDGLVTSETIQKISFENGEKIILSKKVKEYDRNNTITKEINEENGVKKVTIYDDYGKVIK